MKKIIFLLCFYLFVGQTFALEATSSTGGGLVSELNTLITQYEGQLKYLQAENTVLRNEITKAGIKIPLSDFSGVVSAAKGSNTITTDTGVTIITAPNGRVIVRKNRVTKPATNTPVTTVSGELTLALNKIEKENGTRYRNFIEKIIPDWTSIKNAYKLKSNAMLAGYEFVKKGNDDHVFIDIAYEGAGTGVYDVKILYQYNTGTFARKLVGLFEYDRTGRYYATKTGKNPFPGVPRIFVASPQQVVGSNTTSTSTGTVTTTPTIGSGTSSTTNSTSTVTSTTKVTLSEIEKAYGDKRYLSVISLSNSYLASNPATYDLLRIRYRTYFIIGKYSESLAEIEKINLLGRLDKSVACDAQVIATYSKNSTLTNTYTSICKGK